MEEKTFFINDNIFAYKMDKKSSIDIDEEIDFQIAITIQNKRTSNTIKENNI